MSIKDKIRHVHIAWLRSKACCASEFTPQGTVLIVAPHPDDEVLGCGGLIARLMAEGRTPHIIVMTGGEGSHCGCCNLDADTLKKSRRQLTRNAMKKLGVADQYIHELNYPDGGICFEHPETDTLLSLIGQINPDTILVPHWGEGWSDHIVTSDIVTRLAKAEASIYEYCVWMWYYNVWQGLDWENAFKVDMNSADHTKKLEAIAAYVEPLAPCGKPWSGVLPKPFIDAHRGSVELYFKVK